MIDWNIVGIGAVGILIFLMGYFFGEIHQMGENIKTLKKLGEEIKNTRKEYGNE